MRRERRAGSGGHDMKKPARDYVSTSEAGVALIKGFEQFHRSHDGGATATAYRCSAGVWTVGWGHTGPHIRDGVTKTLEECEQILRDDLRWAEDVVRRTVSADITQTQFDALVAFIFNCGEGNWGSSTLRRRVNASAPPGDIEEGFMRFRKARVNGVLTELAGLVRRRRAEAKLFNAPENATVTVSDDGEVFISEAAPAPAPTPAPTPNESGDTQTPQTPAPNQNQSPAPPTTPQEPPGMPQRPLPAPHPRPLPQSRTLWGALLAALAGAASFASTLWAGAAAWWAQLREQMPFDPIWILVGVFVLGITLVVFARIDDQFRRVR